MQKYLLSVFSRQGKKLARVGPDILQKVVESLLRRRKRLVFGLAGLVLFLLAFVSVYRLFQRDQFYHEMVYRTKYWRAPPLNYEKWIAKAKEMKCSLDLNDYARINLDMVPFRETGISPQMLAKAKNLSRTVIVTVEDGHIRLEPNNVWYEVYPFKSVNN